MNFMRVPCCKKWFILILSMIFIFTNQSYSALCFKKPECCCTTKKPVQKTSCCKKENSSDTKDSSQKNDCCKINDVPDTKEGTTQARTSLSTNNQIFYKIDYQFTLSIQNPDHVFFSYTDKPPSKHSRLSIPLRI